MNRFRSWRDGKPLNALIYLQHPEMGSRMVPALRSVRLSGRPTCRREQRPHLLLDCGSRVSTTEQRTLLRSRTEFEVAFLLFAELGLRWQHGALRLVGRQMENTLLRSALFVLSAAQSWCGTLMPGPWATRRGPPIAASTVT